MIDKHKNQSVEIEFWDIEPEYVPELEESDIPGVYFNEFREYVDEECAIPIRGGCNTV